MDEKSEKTYLYWIQFLLHLSIEIAPEMFDQAKPEKFILSRIFLKLSGNYLGNELIHMDYVSA